MVDDNNMQTSSFQAKPATFSAVLKSLPADAVVGFQADGQAIVGDTILPGRPGQLAGSLVRAGHRLTVGGLAELVLSGVFRSLDVVGGKAVAKTPHGDVPVADLGVLARETLRQQYDGAESKGTALIVRTERNRLKAIMGGQDHYLLEGLAEPFLHVGGYYPAFIAPRTRRRQEGNQTIEEPLAVVVPLYFEEEARNIDEARFGFGYNMPWPYVEQAISRAEQHIAAAASQ